MLIKTVFNAWDSHYSVMGRNFAIAILYKSLGILANGISYRNGRNQAFDILYKDSKYEKLKNLVTY